MLRSSILELHASKGSLRWVRLAPVLLAAALSARADNSTNQPRPVIAPPSAWIVPQGFKQLSTETQPDSNADQRVLLVERQIHAAENESFFHFARQMRTVGGVQNNANVTARYNPDYQSLTWHWVRIWRDGNALNRLDADKISLIRQERDLDQFVVNGQQSAVLVLDDVRVGDILDCAYTIKGGNPIFEKQFAAAVQVQLDQAADRLLTRVLWPSQRRLYARAHSCSVQPAVVPRDGLTEYLWDFSGVPAYETEDSLPSWCDPEPWVQLSEFQSWAQVNQWALRLFQAPASLSPELLQKITAWKLIPEPEQRVLAALRFVQDEIRYFGIEIGASAQKPSDPSTVFARRFGDCKDKSLLFVTILRALGVEAWPVLVNTSVRRALDDWQPTTAAFDHCISVVQCDGRTFWLDPTAGYQRGTLSAHFLPNFGRGLVISPRTAGLTAIPLVNGLPQTTTTEYFQLAGRFGQSSLRVVTVAGGRDADTLRALFATGSRNDIEKSYTHFYSELYPGIKTTSPIRMEDDERLNRITTTESYTIDKLWSAPDKDGVIHCEFYPYTIKSLLKKPVDKERKLPMALAYPQSQLLRTEVRLPDVWNPVSENKVVSGESFYFRKNCRCGGNSLVMEYEYRSLQDSVPPAREAEYLKQVGDAEKSLGYILSWR